MTFNISDHTCNHDFIISPVILPLGPKNLLPHKFLHTNLKTVLFITVKKLELVLNKYNSVYYAMKYYLKWKTKNKGKQTMYYKKWTLKILYQLEEVRWKAYYYMELLKIICPEWAEPWRQKYVSNCLRLREKRYLLSTANVCAFSG